MAVARGIVSMTCLLVFFLNVRAQKTIEGIIKNGDTGEPLPYANILVAGTYQGTISNKDGRYILKLNRLPATIRVRYIGFKSREVIIDEQSPSRQDIALQPTVLKMQPVVVTAEDPAVSIMREVIRRKQIWRKKLLTYHARAYTRLGLENDTSIVFISESTSEVFWDAKKGPREVIKSKRETANMRSGDILPASSYIPNFYDDDVEIEGTKVIGPTHPDALKYYTFKLIGQRSRDDKIVFDIAVEPKSKLQPTFEGRVSVLDEEYAMIEVDLKPGKTVMMPYPIQEWNVYHTQQFSDFGQHVWLPLDVRVKGDILISMPGIHFPHIRYNQVSRISNYQVNVLLPDSLYKQKRIVIVDSLSIKSDTLLLARSEMIPLTVREEAAYETIDSTMTLEKAFQPTGFIAWLARLRVGTDEDQRDQKKGGKEKSQQKSKTSEDSLQTKKPRKSIFSGISPDWIYNRVDAFHLGLKYRKPVGKRFIVQVHGAYKTGLKRWAYGGSLTYHLAKKRKSQLKFQLSKGTEPCYHSANYPIFYNTAVNLFGLEDYFDYFWNEKFTVEFSYRFYRFGSRFSLGFRNERHSSLAKQTDYTLFGRRDPQRANPGIDPGKLRSFTLSVKIGTDWVPWGIVSQRNLTLKIEHSSPELFGSDFSFTRYEVALTWRQATYLKRRLLPNMLDVRLVAGTAVGDLPVQRFGILDVRSGAFSPFGVFRTLSGRPVQGEQYLALFWEHNFRTIPFELLGIRYLVKNGVGLVIHGASGRTWISPAKRRLISPQPRILNKFYHELGCSINGIFGFLRLDVTKSLQQEGIYLGFGIARLF